MDKPAAKDRDRPSYPELESKHGEDPARILYSDMDPRPRIRGIQSLALLRAYVEVEGDREEPRKHVIAAINQRLQAVQSQSVASDGGQND
jgi:hypothetical protein